MTLKEFVSKYAGRFVEYHSYDPRAKNQCVDLVNQWLDEGLGLEAIIGANAIDFPSKAVANGMEWIPNFPEGVPAPGDLIIYKGKYGHIDIALDGCTQSKVVAFSQNYPTGSPCVVRTSNYLVPEVVGWIHPEENMSPDEIAVKKTIFEELVKKSTERDDLFNVLGAESLEGAKSVIAGLKSRATDLSNQVGTLKAEVENRQEQVSRLKEQLIKLESDINSLTINLNEKIGDYEILAVAKGKQYIELQQALTTIDTLKQAQSQGEITLSINDLFKLIWNQKITIKKE